MYEKIVRCLQPRERHPIAMPRRASLEAALNPEPGPWLYYVLQDARTHFFTDDYDEFINAKNRAQANGLIP